MGSYPIPPYLPDYSKKKVCMFIQQDKVEAKYGLILYQGGGGDPAKFTESIEAILGLVKNQLS